ARARARVRSRAQEAARSPHGGQPVGPRRQGSRIGRQASRRQGRMTTRIDRRFAALKQEGRAALVAFLTAGDPDHATSLAILKAAPAAGADLVELGMPFSDPMAGGPACPAFYQRDLERGSTMRVWIVAWSTIWSG